MYSQKCGESGKAPAVIVEESGLHQISDIGAIEKEIDSLLSREAGKVAEYQAGKVQLFGYFVGQIMKAMEGESQPRRRK